MQVACGAPAQEPGRAGGISRRATIVCFGFGELRLALAVVVAVRVAGTLATSIGLLFPALQRLGIDPALGSGPLATVVQDVCRLLVYPAVCTLLP